jgi:GT2 family glycosyltransferase
MRRKVERLRLTMPSPSDCEPVATTSQPVPEASIVLPVYNEGARLCQTLAAIRETTDISYEIIVVNDASTDSCCDSLRAAPPPFENLQLVDLPQRGGVAHARNLGAGQARAPVLVAMDAHCIPHPGWLEKLLEELHKPGAGIVAPRISSLECPAVTTFGLTIRDRELGVDWLHQRASKPYPVPLAGCACMVMTREFFEAVGRFDAMRSYGMEDVELCIRCWLLGHSVIMVPDAEVAHCFKREPFPVGWQDYLYNRIRTAVLHFDGEPLERILAALQTKPAFSDAVSSLLASDVWTRYSAVRNLRKHDAAWFCRKFEIAI